MLAASAGVRQWRRAGRGLGFGERRVQVGCKSVLRDIILIHFLMFGEVFFNAYFILEIKDLIYKIKYPIF